MGESLTMRRRVMDEVLRYVNIFYGGRSEESWEMDESLTEQHRVKDEGLRVVNFFSGGRILTVPQE